MNKKQAQKELLLGYFFAFIGLCIGAGTKTNNSIYISMITFGYLFWSGFWGWTITSNRVKSFFSGMHTIESSIFKMFTNFLLQKLIILFIILILSLGIGMLGGAIYKQIKLSFIAYK